LTVGRPVIVVVSGLPRSGTSMVMQMLEAAGMPLLIDEVRAPDEDNPRGYYEFEAVKRLKDDASFLGAASGRAVKIVSPLLPFLPPDYDYRVLFVERALSQVLDSQRAMLERGAARAFSRGLEQVKDWIGDQANIRVCEVSHAQVIAFPTESARRIADFLAPILPGPDESATGLSKGAGADLRIDRMASTVDGSLHRHRRRP
jgi:hypothetical protein